MKYLIAHKEYECRNQIRFRNPASKSPTLQKLWQQTEVTSRPWMRSLFSMTLFISSGHFYHPGVKKHRCVNEWHRCVSLRVPDLILLMPRLVKPTELLKDTEWVSARFWRFTERTVSFWYSAEITFVHSSFIRSLYCSIKYLNTNTGLLNPKLKGDIFKHFYMKMSKKDETFV